MDLRDWSPPPGPASFPVAEVTGPALAAVEEAMAEEAGRVASRRARGCRCFAVCDGAEVRAYGWLTAGPEWIGEAGLEIRPGPREAYIWNCVTLPPHRRRGMFTALVRHITEQARQEGLERLWIASLSGTAERAVLDLGYAPVVRASIRRVGSWDLVRVAPAEAARGILAGIPRGLRRRAWRAH